MVDTAADRSKRVSEEIETAVEANAEQASLVAEIESSIDHLESTMDRLDTSSADDAVVVDRG